MCNARLWNHAPCNAIRGSGLTCRWIRRWQHHAMWHVALWSWYWIRQVAAPTMWQVALGWPAMEFVQTSAILEFYIWFRVWPYHRSRCHSVASLRNLIQIRPPSAEKMTSCRFSRWRISAILGSLKSPCTTSYRHIVNRDYSSKLLSFWENRVFANWRQTDRQQTNKQTDEQMDRPDAWSRSLNKLLHAILA